MTNFLISVVIAIGLVSMTAWGALELFQGARDNYDQQTLSLRLEQVGAAIKSKIVMIDGLPSLPAPTIYNSSYPTVPSWITANAIDTNGNPFVYCPYALRPTTNLEGTADTVTGPGYNIIKYQSTLFGKNNPYYVVGSDKPALLATSQSASLTLTATSGYNKSASVGSGVFSSSSVGQTITSGAGVAVITGYSDAQDVIVNITQNFNSTSIASGNWSLSSVVPKGLLGFVIAYKPHDTGASSASPSACSNVKMTESGAYSVNVNGLSPLVYPIIVGQSQYQQAYAKSDNVTYYVSSTTSGDGSGRDQNNQINLQGAMSLIAALHPARATIYLSSGTHYLLTQPYDSFFEPENLRGMTLTIDGTGGSNPIVMLLGDYNSNNIPYAFDWPANLVLKNLTLDAKDDYLGSIEGPPIIESANSATKWIFDGVTVTNDVPVYVANTLWARGNTSFNGGLIINTAGKLYINGTVSAENNYNSSLLGWAVHNSGMPFYENGTPSSCSSLLISSGGELDILPNESLTYTDNGCGQTEVNVQNGGTLNVSGTLNLTSVSGSQATPYIYVQPGGFANFNNAALNFYSGLITSHIKAPTGFGGSSTHSSIFVDGEMNLNNTSVQFPSGVGDTSDVGYHIAAVDLISGGKFTMHNGSVIGSSSTTSKRTYYGVYDDGGSFVGGSSTGCSTPTSCTSGQGGSVQSNIYVNSVAGAECWGGTPLPAVTATLSSQQQRHLFWDSPEGDGTTSAPRGTNNSAFQTTSSTSVAIGLGLIEVSLNGYVPYAAPGDEIVIESRLNPSNYMAGYIVSHYIPYGGYGGLELTINVTQFGGNGTYSDWDVAGGLDMRHLVLANQTNWACHNPNTITSPSAFTFATPGSSCPVPASDTSETILPTGYNSQANISINDMGTGSSPQYSLDGGNSWSAIGGSGTITPGQTLTLRVTPSANASSAQEAKVTIGSTSYTWTVPINTSCLGTVANGNQGSGTSTNSSGVTAYFNRPTTAGDLIVGTVAYILTNPSDTGYFYFCDAAYSGVCGGGYNYSWSNYQANTPIIASFYYPNIPAGITGFIVGFVPNSGSFVPANAVLIITEYNIHNTNPLDQSANSSGSSVSINPSQASELIVGSNAVVVGSGTPTITPIYPTGDMISATSGPLTLVQTDTLINSTATQTANYTDSGNSVINFTGISSFKVP